MPSQRDLAALRAAVRVAGFTPGVRDVGALVELLGDRDEAVARDAEAALGRALDERQGPSAARALDRMLASLDGTTGVARARGLDVLGRAAPKVGGAATIAIAALRSDDLRVQRAGAHALGRLVSSEARASIDAAIVEAWDRGPEASVARALAETMGKLGIVAAMGRLGAVGDAEPELGRIAQKALAMLRRDGTRGEASGIDSDAHVAGELAVVFLCRGGLERIVAEEIEARIPSARDISPGAPGGGRVTARWRGRLAELLTVRTALEFGVALPVGRSGADHELCVRALASEEAKTAIAAWTTGSVRYRIQWAGQGHRRGATWSVVRAVGESEPSWVNDPTASTWEVRVDVHAAPPTALLVPRKLVDRRFAYRERDVPAASHPTLAAALVRASRPRANDVVWDPFVGSGTELIERAKVGPFAKLLGTDTDARALDVARANARAAEVPLSLERGDATRHRPPAVSAILTNPPMGRRVARDGSLADLLDAFVDHASTVLVADGRLVWLSPLGGRTAARAEARGLTVVLREPVDMGGFFAELQVFESRRRAY